MVLSQRHRMRPAVCSRSHSSLPVARVPGGRDAANQMFDSRLHASIRRYTIHRAAGEQGSFDSASLRENDRRSFAISKHVPTSGSHVGSGLCSPIRASTRDGAWNTGCAMDTGRVHTRSRTSYKESMTECASPKRSPRPRKKKTPDRSLTSTPNFDNQNVVVTSRRLYTL